MKDFDNTVAKLDNDYLSYNLSNAKWEPKTFELEVENYLSLRALNNTLIATQTVGLIWIPIFNNINVSQTYFGDFIAITSNYSLWFTRQCLVQFIFGFTSDDNNFNFYITLNGDVNNIFNSAWTQANNSTCVSFIYKFSANDEIFFNSD